MYYIHSIYLRVLIIKSKFLFQWAFLPLCSIRQLVELMFFWWGNKSEVACQIVNIIVYLKLSKFLINPHLIRGPPRPPKSPPIIEWIMNCYEL